MSIKILSRKYRKEITLLLLIFLVAFLSFGLGYLAALQDNHSPIIIEYARENQ